MEFLWFLLIGLVAGWLAGKLTKGGGFGVGGDIAIGILGAVFGGWLFGQLGVAVGGGAFSAIFRATVGAVLLLFLIRVVKRA